MSVLKILIFPDPRLRTAAKPVREIDNEIKKLTKDMVETMYEGNGIGLSATQVNIHKRIIVVDTSNEKDSPLVLINPKIEALNPEQKSIYEEGCLSVPGFYEEVERPTRIKAIALNEEGKKIITEADGLLSATIQHEVDHLEGRIFVDYLSNLKRQVIRKKLLKSLKKTA